MAWRLLADGLALLHFSFVLFVLLGALAVLRWPKLAWLHLPAALWGALIEFAGWICPLTPLENMARAAAGKAGYASGFIDHYLRALIYPEGLTRELQLLFGTIVVVLNIALYLLVWKRIRQRDSS